VDSLDQRANPKLEEMTMTLRPSTSGALDHRTLTVAYIQARAENDSYKMLRLLGAPELIARRASAFAELRAINPHLDAATEERVVRQKLEIAGHAEARSTAPLFSESELRRRVAAVGLAVAADRVALAKRDDATDEEEDDTSVTCPSCGHIFDPEDDTEE
jgi:hypothetical protein